MIRVQQAHNEYIVNGIFNERRKRDIEREVILEAFSDIEDSAASWQFVICSSIFVGLLLLLVFFVVK